MEKKIIINADYAVFISDIHFGIKQNNIEWQDNQRKYFSDFFIPFIKQLKKQIKPDEHLIVINIGDTFNDRQTIDIEVNNLAIDIMEDIAKEVELIILNGNHDLSKKTNEGATSLRSMTWIPNVTLVTKPMPIDFTHSTGDVTHTIAIPYLGDFSKETQCLAKYSKSTDYAFMHTELTKMRMDNGTLISGGVNTELYDGFVFSGHIHKRQESKKSIYVGSPYHMTQSDIGDQKGVYLLDFKTKKLSFTPNKVSPVIQEITVNDFMKMSEEEKQNALNNNYTNILINEEDVPQFKKKYNIYALGAGTTAKSVLPVIINKKQHLDIDLEKDYHELSVWELLKDSIEQLDTDDDTKDRLLNQGQKYLHDAELQMSSV